MGVHRSLAPSHNSRLYDLLVLTYHTAVEIWPLYLEFKGDAWLEAFVTVNYPCQKASSYSDAVSNLNLFRGISKNGFLGLLRLANRSSSNAREAIKAIGDSADGSSS